MDHNFGSIFKIFCPLQSKVSYCSDPFCSQCLRKPASRYKIALHSPIHLNSPASHSEAFYLLSQDQVQPLSLKAFISGELTWQQGGFLSSALSRKASGIMCQLALFYRIFVCSFRRCYGISWCLLPGSRWNDSDFYKIGSLLLASNTLPRLFCVKVKKGAFTGETGFPACYYTPHRLHLGQERNVAQTIWHAHVALHCTLPVCKSL